MLLGRLVAELVGREDGLDRLRPARLVAGVDVGEQGTLLDARTALDMADDADGVVDLVLLVRRPAPRWSAAIPTPIAPSLVTEPARGAFTGRTTGACGNAAGSGSPPCARIQRS